MGTKISQLTAGSVPDSDAQYPAASGSSNRKFTQSGVERAFREHNNQMINISIPSPTGGQEVFLGPWSNYSSLIQRVRHFSLPSGSPISWDLRILGSGSPEATGDSVLNGYTESTIVPTNEDSISQPTIGAYDNLKLVISGSETPTDLVISIEAKRSTEG